MFDLKYVIPSKDMTDFVSVFYLLQSDEENIEELERADIAQLRFVLAGEGVIQFPDGAVETFKPVSLCGPRNSASKIIAKGPIKTFGLGLRPAGWAMLTGADAMQFADRIVDGAVHLSANIMTLHAKLMKAKSIDEMALATDQFARANVFQPHSTPFWFIRAVDQWLETNIAPEIDALMETTKLSRRQVDKLIKQLYGSTPGLLVRKYKALQTASAISSGVGAWQDYAADFYYDQSHCIRDLKRFTGLTPSAIKDKTARLPKQTFERRNLAGLTANIILKT